MGEIKRWDVESQDGRDCKVMALEDGDYVLHSDHEAEVARLRVMAQEQGVKDGNEITRLRAELNAATKAGLDAIATICEKEREADALRVDAMRWWFVCEQMEVENDDDEYGFWCSTVTLKSGYIYPPPSPYYETVNQAIDAAMGEGK